MRMTKSANSALMTASGKRTRQPCFAGTSAAIAAAATSGKIEPSAAFSALKEVAEALSSWPSSCVRPTTTMTSARTVNVGAIQAGRPGVGEEEPAALGGVVLAAMSFTALRSRRAWRISVS